MEKIGESLAASMGDGAKVSITKLEEIGRRADEIAEKKRVITMEVKEVSGASGGAVVGVQGAASGAIAGPIRWQNGLNGLRIAGAPSTVDTHPFFLASGETVTNAAASKNVGYDTWRHINNQDMVGAARAMVKNHPYLQPIFSPPAEIRFAQPQQQQTSGLDGMQIYLEQHPFDGRIIKKIMLPEDREFEKQHQARTVNLMEKLSRKS